MTIARIIPASVTSTPIAIMQTDHTIAFVRVATQATGKLAQELVRTLPTFADWLLEGF